MCKFNIFPCIRTVSTTGVRPHSFTFNSFVCLLNRSISDATFLLSGHFSKSFKDLGLFSSRIFAMSWMNWTLSSAKFLFSFLAWASYLNCGWQLRKDNISSHYFPSQPNTEPPTKSNFHPFLLIDSYISCLKIFVINNLESRYWPGVCPCLWEASKVQFNSRDHATCKFLVDWSNLLLSKMASFNFIFLDHSYFDAVVMKVDLKQDNKLYGQYFQLGQELFI